MSAPAEHFDSLEHQRQSAELGMWVFLATELMFFGPLLLAYAYGRYRYPVGFAIASGHTNVLIGTVNTALLLTSSLAMALAVRAAQLRRARSAAWLLALTAVLGVAFLGLKGLEYAQDGHEQLVPWLAFRFEGPLRTATALFYDLYFALTGLHALHLSIGVVVAIVFAVRARHAPAALPRQVEIAGLYWHFVDCVWVFLYPMIYLIDRHG